MYSRLEQVRVVVKRATTTITPRAMRTKAKPARIRPVRGKEVRTARAKTVKVSSSSKLNKPVADMAAGRCKIKIRGSVLQAGPAVGFRTLGVGARGAGSRTGDS